ncbi:MAG: hypothetical protein RL208_392, partial [Pseudomonadota bacterium]
MFDKVIDYVNTHFMEIMIVMVLIFFIAKINRYYNIEKFVNYCDLTIKNNSCSNLTLTVGNTL